VKYPGLESLLTKHPTHRALLRALRRLAAAAGKTKADADAAYHDVRLAIESLENRILREGRSGERKRIAKAPPTSPHCAPAITIKRLVRTKAHELGIGQQRLRNAWEIALKQFPLDEAEAQADLTPVETRAFEIVRGRPRKARKNFAEVNAIQIADAVLAEWPLLAQRVGRPAGRRCIVRDPKTLEYDLKLSAREIIEAVLTSIEALAGPENSSAPGSEMIAAVVTAVKAANMDTQSASEDNKIKAAGTATQTAFDEERASSIVQKLQRRGPIS
jgi:hypothetical protein